MTPRPDEMPENRKYLVRINTFELEGTPPREIFFSILNSEKHSPRDLGRYQIPVDQFERLKEEMDIACNRDLIGRECVITYQGTTRKSEAGEYLENDKTTDIRAATWRDFEKTDALI